VVINWDRLTGLCRSAGGGGSSAGCVCEKLEMAV